MLVSSMMRMLLLVMTLLLMVPRWLSLRVLLLVREDMLWVDHFEGRRVIQRRSDVVLVSPQVLSGDERRQKRNIIETSEASEVRGSNEGLLEYSRKLMQALDPACCSQIVCWSFAEEANRKQKR